MVTVDDLIERWRSLSSDEIDKATIYISDCENLLHLYAHDRGLDLDAMLTEYEPRAEVYTAVVCDVVRREMNDGVNDSPAMSQYSQSVNGYNVQGTFLNPGGGLFIKNAELEMLGLLPRKMGQKARAVELYEY